MMEGFLIDGLLVFLTGVLSIAGMATLIWWSFSKLKM